MTVIVVVTMARSTAVRQVSKIVQKDSPSNAIAVERRRLVRLADLDSKRPQSVREVKRIAVL